MIDTAQETTQEAVTEAAPAAPRRRISFYTLGLLCILAASAALRLWGINFGLPHLYHWDEKLYFHAAFYGLASGGGAESLSYGNIPYLLIPIYWVMSLVRGVPLDAGGLQRLVSLYLEDPTPFFLAGKGVWVAAELFTVWLTYRIGARVLSRPAGLLAAAFLGAAFLFVSEGHYVKGDTTAMLGVALTAWAALALITRPTWGRYAFLGAAIGLSIAFKFYTYPLVLVALIAHLLAWPDNRARLKSWWLLVVSGVASLAAFLVALPGFLLHPGRTLEVLRIEAAIPFPNAVTEGQPLWLYYWTGHILQGIGLPLELCGIAGLVLWVLRRDKSRLLLLAILALVWVGLVSRGNSFARYSLPMLPFICLAAGDFLARAASYLASRLPVNATRALVPAGLTLVTGLLVLPSLLNDLRFDTYLSSRDTRTLAANWVEEHIPAGATIVEEGGQGFEGVSTLGPPLRAAPSAVGQTWSPSFLREPVEFWNKPLLGWLETYTPTYRLTFAPTLTRFKNITTTAGWGSPDAFVILSWRSDPEKGTPPSPIWEDLNRNYTEAARFDCSPCFPDDPYAWAIDYNVLGRVRPFSAQTVAVPRVWVYTRK